MSSLNILLLFVIVINSVSLTISKEDKSSSTVNSNSHKYHVHVIHDMSPAKTLLVHCKSKEDDLGIHYISKGEEVAWSFRPNIFGTTLFWCYLAPDNDSHATFNVFWFDETLYEKCHYENCVWFAKDDGIYLLNIPAQIQELRVKWEHGRYNADKKHKPLY